MIHTISETCRCGASFNYSGSAPSSAAGAWRREHQCVPGVEPGICGDLAQPLVMTGGVIDRPHCRLKAGHAGMHDGGDGRHWTKAHVEDADA